MLRPSERLVRDLRLARTLGAAIPGLLKARPGAAHTVADFLAPKLSRSATRPALVFEDDVVTYGELDRRSNQVARWAQSQGIGRGDAVALLMENRPDYVWIWLGLAKIGAVTALINTNLTGRPLAHTVELAAADIMILHEPLAEHWRAAADETSAAPDVWISDTDNDGAAPEQRVDSGVAGEPFDAAVASQSGAPLAPDVRAGLTADDRLFYIYTSGTTGLPKAANFSHQRFIATALGARSLAQLTAADHMYVTLPLYHTAGGVMALGGILAAGGTAVIARRFSTSRFWDDCDRYGVTAFQYIGELCRYLLNAPPHEHERDHRLRVCLGNGLRPEVWEPFQTRFAIPRIVEFYGATEGNVVLVNVDNKVGAIGRLPGLVKRAMGLHLIQIDLETGQAVRGTDGHCIDVGVDEPGEAIGRISATGRFEGYTDEGATESKILHDVFKQGDRYFRSGDLLRRDGDNYVYFVDRLGDTFRWKGENVSTSEVAEALSGAPGVLEANVYGVEVPGADGRAGMASLVVDDDFDPGDLAHWLESRLASYAAPVFLRLTSEVEITGTFKHRKVDAAREGFDPSLIDDPLYVRLPSGYVDLDGDLYRQIVAGDQRL